MAAHRGRRRDVSDTANRTEVIASARGPRRRSPPGFPAASQEMARCVDVDETTPLPECMSSSVRLVARSRIEGFRLDDPDAIVAEIGQRTVQQRGARAPSPPPGSHGDPEHLGSLSRAPVDHHETDRAAVGVQHDPGGVRRKVDPYRVDNVIGEVVGQSRDDVHARGGVGSRRASRFEDWLSRGRTRSTTCTGRPARGWRR